jgi:hypothetical protein
MQLLHRSIVGALVLLLVNVALGGSIGEREKEVRQRSEVKKEKNSTPSKQQGDAAYSSFGSGTYPSSSSGSSGGFIADVWGWMLLAPFSYRHDDPSSSMLDEEGDWAGEPSSVFPRRTIGQATIPYFRVDYNRQFSDWDPDDLRVEAGYKFAALHGRVTRYTDESGTVLDLCQYYGVLRYGGYRPDFLPGTFEFAFGLGVVQHTHDVETMYSGGLTVPLKYYPFDWLGVEFRPAWYKWDEVSLSDYDLSVSTGYRYIQVRGGYRWIWDNDVVSEQSGPYVGVSASF